MRGEFSSEPLFFISNQHKKHHQINPPTNNHYNHHHSTTLPQKDSPKPHTHNHHSLTHHTNTLPPFPHTLHNQITLISLIQQPLILYTHQPVAVLIRHPWRYQYGIRGGTNTVSVAVPIRHPWRYQYGIRGGTNTASVAVPIRHPWQYQYGIRGSTNTAPVAVPIRLTISLTKHLKYIGKKHQHKQTNTLDTNKQKYIHYFTSNHHSTPTLQSLSHTFKKTQTISQNHNKHFTAAYPQHKK